MTVRIAELVDRQDEQPLFLWEGDHWWPSPRGVKWLWAHYHCCLEPRRWCSAANSEKAERLKRPKGQHGDSQELVITEIKVSLDTTTASLPNRLRWAARYQRAHGPGNRDYDWTAQRAERAGITVRAARGRLARAAAVVSKRMRGR